MSRLSRVAGCLSVAFLIAGLSACQADGGSGSPDSASSTSAPVPADQEPETSSADSKSDIVEKHWAAAEKRHREFLQIRNDHAKKGKDPFVTLLNKGYLGNEDMQKSEQSFWSDYVDLGLKQKGESHIDSVETVEYEGDPQEGDITGHRAHFKVCMNNADYDVVRPDGSSAIEKGPDRLMMSVVMQGQPSGLWSVSETRASGQEC